MSMPKVSFIVAVYNSLPYLEACLDSLCAQTIKDVEIICVNDCSPDQSSDFIREYMKKDDRVILIEHETNKRQGGAWNTGVAAATGEYVCFVDADDWLEKDYGETVSDSGADYYCPSKLFEGNKEVDNVSSERFFRCGQDIYLYNLLYGGFLLGCFIKRELFITSQFKFVENNMYHDLIAIVLLAYAQRVEVFDRVGYHYRVDNTSIQRSMNQHGFWGRLEVMLMAHAACKALPTASRYAEAIDYRFYCLYYRNSLIRAYYGFTELPWDRIDQILAVTKETVPDIRKNCYYRFRFEDMSLSQRWPLFLFGFFPKSVVNLIHTMEKSVKKWKRKIFL